MPLTVGRSGPADDGRPEQEQDLSQFLATTLSSLQGRLAQASEELAGRETRLCAAQLAQETKARQLEQAAHEDALQRRAVEQRAEEADQGRREETQRRQEAERRAESEAQRADDEA